MPDNFASWIGLGISIVVFLGAAWVYLSGSKDKGTIGTLEANNKALTERVGILERQVLDLTAQRGTDQGRIAALERENSNLLSLRPSAERLDGIEATAKSIEAKLGEHDTETTRLLDAIITNVSGESHGSQS